MLDYVSKEPPPGSPEVVLIKYVCVQRYNQLFTRYPMICCHVLCSPISSIADTFVKTPTFLDTILAFLYIPPEQRQLPWLLRNYCAQVALSMLYRKPNEMAALLRRKAGFIPKLVSCITSPGIPELVSKLAGTEFEEVVTVISKILTFFSSHVTHSSTNSFRVLVQVYQTMYTNPHK